jgi:hypothetical protein
MSPRDRETVDDRGRMTNSLLSRRAVAGASGLVLASLLCGVALGQEERRPRDGGGPDAAGRTRGQEMMEQFRAMSERMRNASPEERMKIMAEQRAQQRRRAIEDLKEQLGVSDAEWAVLKPRVEAVYNLVHPEPPIRGNGSQPRTDVEQRSAELRELLRDENAAADQIKARLAALRAAREKANRDLVAARQNLRQLLTLRQEAQLVLNGLLD